MCLLDLVMNPMLVYIHNTSRIGTRADNSWPVTY